MLSAGELKGPESKRCLLLPFLIGIMNAPVGEYESQTAEINLVKTTKKYKLY